ncbi:hypothetical protein ABW20_dc0109549 [Dactylellina cionopaga]|nr:hypothetical protein ABW20_dc0109549 [Dactylellina cionopaga]
MAPTSDVRDPKSQIPTLPLDIQFLILDAADLEDQPTLAKTSKSLHRCLQYSSVARLKRYQEQTLSLNWEFHEGQNDTTPIAQEDTDNAVPVTNSIPVILHRLFRCYESYSFKDEDGAPMIPSTEDGEHSELRIFRDDPIFLRPKQTTENITHDDGRIVNEAKITISQYVKYKHMAGGQFSFQIGEGEYVFQDSIGFNQTGSLMTMGEYTDLMLQRIEEIIEDAKKHPDEISEDRQNMEAWERITTQDASFEFSFVNTLPYTEIQFGEDDFMLEAFDYSPDQIPSTLDFDFDPNYVWGDGL